MAAVVNPIAYYYIDKIVKSNKAENDAVKKAKGFQAFVNQGPTPGYTPSERSSDAKSANANWKNAISAAQKTVTWINKLWSIQYGDGWLSHPENTYPMVRIQTLSAINDQNKLHSGLDGSQRIANYSATVAANDQRIKNLSHIKLDFSSMTQPDDGTTDTNGVVNVNVPVSVQTGNASPTIDPSTTGVPVPGAEPDPTGQSPVDPATGAPLAEDEPAGPWTFERLALLGAAAAAGIFWYTTRR